MTKWAGISLSGPDLTRTWKPGERVELVLATWDSYGPPPRPGVVVAVDEVSLRHHRLRVRFDDGEERYINPDVMRHERGSR